MCLFIHLASLTHNNDMVKDIKRLENTIVKIKVLAFN